MKIILLSFLTRVLSEVYVGGGVQLIGGTGNCDLCVRATGNSGNEAGRDDDLLERTRLQREVSPGSFLGVVIALLVLRSCSALLVFFLRPTFCFGCLKRMFLI